MMLTRDKPKCLIGGALTLFVLCLARPALPADRLPPLEAQFPELLDVDRLLEEFKRIEAQYPEAEHSLAALARQLGEAPEQAFAYVRDRIAYAPYSGMLRGAEGTLNAREGNHLDRALLLRELLRLQGHEARLVYGQIAARSAGGLRQRLLADAPADDTSPEPALALLGLGTNALARLQARRLRDEPVLLAALADRIDAVDLGNGADIERQRHVWVQVRVRGEWLDLDPTLKTASPGETLAYFEDALDAPAAEDLHAVELTLFAESVRDDGSLQRESVLLESVVAAEAAPAQIFLSFAPDPGSSAFGAGALTRAAGEEVRHRPSLMVDGEISNGSLLPRIGETKSEVQSFLFGEDETHPVLAALQLEVTVRYPGGEYRRTRTLLDRITPEDRLAGDFAVDRLLPLQMIDTTPSYLGSVHQIIISNGAANPRRLAADIAFGFDFFGRQLLDPEQFGERSLHELLWPIGARNLALALAAERLSLAGLNDRADLRFFIGAPRVYLTSIVPHGSADEALRDVEVDLLVDHVNWTAAADTSSGEVVTRRIRYGIAQQALETTLSELAAVANGLDDSAVTSASQLLEQGLRQVGTGDPQAQDFPPALLADSNGNNTVLAAPGQHETWWTFSADDGSLTARLAPGLGGSRLSGTLPRSSAAGGRVGDIIRQPASAPGTYRQVGNQIVREGAGSPSNNCSGGGTEYTIVMCNVSIKISMSTGTAYAIIAGEIVASVLATVLQLL